MCGDSDDSDGSVVVWSHGDDNEAQWGDITLMIVLHSSISDSDDDTDTHEVY